MKMSGMRGVFFTCECACPLYADLRRRLPFRGEDVVVEGFVTQGDGCTPRNLQALTRAITDTPHYNEAFGLKALLV